MRPYYIPPSVGPPSDLHTHPSTASNIGSRNASTTTAANSFGSSARNILADMDYTEYISDAAPSNSEVVKQLVEQALWKYTSVFLAQPFEVAKTVLQVQLLEGGQRLPSQARAADKARRYADSYRDSDEPYDVCSSFTNWVLKGIDIHVQTSDGSDTDSQSYFTPSAPQSHTPSRLSRSRRRRGSPDIPIDSLLQSPHKAPHFPHSLGLRSPSSLIAVLSALWAKEGAWGIWKGTNSTYVYTILLSTITSFTRSFLAAVLGLSGPGFSFQPSAPFTYAGGLDILSSPSPFVSLAIAVSAAGITGSILAPLDIARTKIMLTPSTHPPRSIISTLKSLSTWSLPFSIAPVTIIHSALSTLFSASIPLFLRSRLGVDPLLTPNLYSIGTFIGQAMELLVKLPFETVLRRGQMHVAQMRASGKEVQTVVSIGPYRGLIGTMYAIVKEEGIRGSPGNARKGIEGALAVRSSQLRTVIQGERGQGLEGLWRGWRVGMWALIGVWGAAAVGSVGSTGDEF